MADSCWVALDQLLPGTPHGSADAIAVVCPERELTADTFGLLLYGRCAARPDQDQLLHLTQCHDWRCCLCLPSKRGHHHNRRYCH